ncbi:MULTISPECIES: threo-3-hydroxy-L-aspartate ammonia-lyase [Subtercola]|uniref:threonine ammonia-lyase n=1 Tax=Subtercola vilae TaxID=2056433 RepID=A0A4T2CAI9_9MICO|nr:MULTISPECIES: threo-3-hydroxy-L-aspartate ammonia-lyase [Subtercola]MEA9986440.1 threo-3-hydroxy-L-aspartate ammonia-lyase [Subtercola sp. RTI3]TIH40381.1 threo-3-hydroxy-L-aspartate ammonia-lyase [Subtercola vilae]
MPEATTALLTFDDVEQAAARIRSYVNHTPVMTSRTLNELTGAEVFFKCENFQRVGAFKARGAFNALLRLGDDERSRGVVAFSSGNHAQAVALAARTLGIAATIVMPRDAPPVKKAATLGYGATVVEYDRYTENREEVAAGFVRGAGMTLVPPYDHADIAAGQGTAALELFDEVGELDALFVPVGGGGLLAGSALAASGRSPRTRVYGVEPAAGDDARQSFRSGAIVSIPTPDTIADGAQTQRMGEVTFEVMRRLVTDMLTADDPALVEAMEFFASRMKLIVEPTGCLGLAAVLAAGRELAGQRVGVIVSGGNVDLARFAALISAH